MSSIAHLNQNIRALCREARLKEALRILLATHNNVVEFSTYIHLLHACIAKKALSEGKQIHLHMNDRALPFTPHTYLQNALINMYDKCGSLADARNIFDQLGEPDVFSWNMIIAAHKRHGFPQEAFTLFHQMQRTAVHPDQYTFSAVLPVCAELPSLKHGIQIHAKIIRYGLQSNLIVANTVMDMYAKCGNMQKARELFDKMPEADVISCNAMITGYAQNGAFDEALRLFKEMSQRNVVSWTAMIAGYVQNGRAEKALELFKQMQQEGKNPNPTTFASILPAFGKIGALEQGMEINQKIIKSGSLSDIVVSNALIDMYAKCGCIHKARKLFNKAPQRNSISWNAMIAGYAMHGYSQDALEFFELMKHSGTNPDSVSLVCVLFVCSHAGLVDEGCKYFKFTSDFYCIMLTIEHYVCMVDLLGRAGHLDEALNFVIKMPIQPNVVMWKCLLGACRSYKDIELGEFVATLLFELDPTNTAPYVLLSNIYAIEGRWGEVQKLRKLMKDRGIKKLPGCSWIEVHKIVHAFCAEYKSHPQR